MSVIEAYRAVAGFAACIIELLTCVSEFTSENSVTSPARAHAANGKRVFTGRVPTIFNMAILPRCARIPALRLIFPGEAHIATPHCMTASFGRLNPTSGVDRRRYWQACGRMV